MHMRAWQEKKWICRWNKAHTEELQLPRPPDTAAEATANIQTQDMNP